MKRSTLTIVLSLFVTVIFAQGTNEGVVNNTSEVLTRAFNVNQSSFGSSAVFVNPPRRVEGSIYLYNGWESTGIIQTNDNKRVAVGRVNFNLRRNRIVAKYSTDSIFVFDLRTFNKMIINGMTFKKFETETDSRIFEVIFETEKASLLNFHHLKVVEGSANPMVNRKVDKFKHTEDYFLYKDNELTEFKLNKRGVLSIFAGDDAEKKKQIAQFYKSKKLSYKKPEALRQLLASDIL